MSLVSYKYRLKPTPEQEVLINKHFGCVRFLYNYWLAERITTYQNEGKTLNYYDNTKSLPELKKKLPWLKEPSSQSLQYSAKCLQNGYDNFFSKCRQNTKGKKGFPLFKKKYSKQSFRVQQNIKLIDGKVSLPKFKEGIRILIHRPLRGEVKFATVSKNKADEYYISITTSREIPKLKLSKMTIGIDLNISGIVGSDGTKHKNPLPKTKKYAKRLRFLNKAKNRTQKEGKGRREACLKINKLEQHIKNIREDFQHKISTKIVNENQVIILETLCVKNMLKNADPKTRKIERWRERAYHRKQNDASFSSFIQKLKYKCEWYGRELRQVNKWFPSSQLCSICGWQNKELTLEQREWTCWKCWTTHDRDENAATNIHNEGITPRWNRGLVVCPDIRPVQDGLLVGTEASTL